MLRLCLSGLRAHLVRTVLTGLAVMLGVAFVAGTLLYADTAKAGFYDDFARLGANVDVAVNPPGPDGYDTSHLLDDDDLARVRAVAGVSRADGRVVGDLAVLGRDGRALSNLGRVGFAVSVPDPSLNPFRVVAGTMPGREREVALDRNTAERLGLSTEDSVTVLDRVGDRRQLTVVGIVDHGSGPVFDGWSVAVLTTEDLTTLTGQTGYASIVASAQPGVEPSHLRDAIREALSGTNVVTGDEMRTQLARDSAKYVDGFLAVLLASSIVALVVAVLVVYNTFTIVVAQRVRELALLRCLGTSRRQLVALVVGESVVVGALASAAGVAGSFAVARLVEIGRDVVGAAEPQHPLVVTPSSIVVGFAVGVVATVAAGLLPAVRASRVSPLAALRTVSTEARPRVRIALALALGVIGVAILPMGNGFDATTRLIAGAMVLFVALVVVLPLVVPRLTAIVGWLPARAFGVPARLAVDGARQHPARATAATVALMIGVALTSLFAVVLATARDQAARELAENFPIDFALEAVSHGGDDDVLPAALATELRQRPEFDVVLSARLDYVWSDAGRITVSAMGDGGTAEVVRGSLDDLGAGGVALRARFAYANNIDVGDRLTTATFSGSDVDDRVVAIFDDAPVEGDMLMSWSDFGSRFGEHGDRLLIRRSASVSPAAAQSTLDAVLENFPLVSVSSGAERRAALTEQLERRLTQFGSLLMVSTVIAVLGIMDTLALSVIERTGESATLRALGLSRRQLKAMLLIEAMLMALIGALVGVAFGVAVGWFTADSLITAYGHGVPTVPLAQLAAYVALAALAGAIASLVPARRASRTAIVAMMDT